MTTNPFGQQLRANRDNVWKAAQALVEQGSQPSVNNVRSWLGGGSNSSISRYLQEWHASSQEERSVRLATPLHLQQSLDALFQQMEGEKKAAIDSAEQAVLDKVTQLQAERDQALNELAEAKETLAALGNQLAEGQRQLQQAKDEQSQQQKLLTESQRQVALLRQQASQWQREAEDNRAQVSHLFHQQQHFQERWQAEQSKRQEAFEEARWQWLQQERQLQEQVQSLGEENRNLSGMVSGFQEAKVRLESQRAELSRQQGRIALLEGELASSNQRLAEQPKVDLAAQFEKQQSMLVELSQELGFLTEQVKKRQQLKSELEAIKSSLGNP